MSNRGKGSYEQDAADQANQQSAVLLAVEKTLQNQEKTRATQQEAERQQRTAAIARRRRSKRRGGWIMPIINGLAGLATVVIMCLTAVYVHYSRKQWTEMQAQTGSLAQQVADEQKSFAATWRAAVYVGLPDGTFAEIVRDKSNLKNDDIVIHSRNYGASTAENTIVELWVIVFPEGQPVIQKFRPFYNFSDDKPHPTGVSIPPGFPFKSSHTLTKSDCKLVDTDKAGMEVVGRLSYTDAFGKYCQPFAVGYDLKSGFSLSGNPSDKLCSGLPHEGKFYRVKVGPKPTRVWPPPDNLKPKIIDDP